LTFASQAIRLYDDIGDNSFRSLSAIDYKMSGHGNATSGSSYQAAYEQNNAQVQFRDFAMTLVGCLGSQGEQENLYLQALMHAETLDLAGNVMTITGSKGKDVLRFSSAQQ